MLFSAAWDALKLIEGLNLKSMFEKKISLLESNQFQVTLLNLQFFPAV